MALIVVKNYYSLSIWIYSDGFSLYVHDENNQVLSSKHNVKLEGTDEVEFLEQTLAAQEEVNAVYNEISVTYESAYHTYIPEIFHTTETEKDFLILQHPALPDSYEIFHTKDTNLQSVLIYGIDEKIIETINKHLPTAIITSHLVSIAKKITSDANEVLLIWVRVTEIDCIVYKNNAIVLLNKYSFKNVEDILYTIVNIYQQLGLSPNEFRTEIYDDESILNEAILKEYISNISVTSKKTVYEDYQWRI